MHLEFIPYAKKRQVAERGIGARPLERILSLFPMLRKGRLIKPLFVLTLIAIGLGSFFWVRHLTAGEASKGGELHPFVNEQNRLAEEDAAKPKFEGTINGITFQTRETATREATGCRDIPGLRAEHVHPDTAKGTDLDIDLSYPADATIAESWAGSCAGELVVLEQLFHSSDATFRVTRVRERRVITDVPADRLVEGSIGGRPAVFERPANQLTLFVFILLNHLA